MGESPVTGGNSWAPQGLCLLPELFSRFPSLRAGVSTRRGGVSPEPLGLNLSFNVGDAPSNVNENRRRFLGALGIPVGRVAIPYQIHSAVVQRARTPGRYDSCDALVTNTAGLFVAVSVADCLPILLYDPVAGAVAAVHSGWRGSRGKILLHALLTLGREFGSLPSALFAFIGPGAGGCCYEVGEDVAREFPADCVIRSGESKPRLDLKRFNRILLLDAGVPGENIELSPCCTICAPAVFHSYRREGRSSGRMMAVIGLTE